VTRAPALPPDERRTALVEATLPLLYEHGRSVTTRLIAEAAGVAEGTIFRVFATKDELIDAAVLHAFRPGRMIEDTREIPADADLDETALALVRILQGRFAKAFLLMQRLGMTGPPPPGEAGWADRVAEGMRAMTDLIGPFQDDLIMPADHVVRLLRLVTFSGTHPKFAGGEPLTDRQIVDAVLYGAVRREDS
jgi:AcrR family transcriptional regulator